MKRSLFLIVIALFALYFSLSVLGADWFDPDWYARRPMIIDNRLNNNELFDYQLKFVIPYYDSAQSDFDDIRFTAEDETILIPYWLEIHQNSQYALFTVKVPHIPALDTTIIYLYYGNPNTISESNGEAVFEFFDDFSDEDISDWAIIGGDWIADNRFLEQLLLGNHLKINSLYTLPDSCIAEATMAYLSSYLYSGNHIMFSSDYPCNNGYKCGFGGLNVGGTWIARLSSGSSTKLASDSTIHVGNYGFTRLRARMSYNGKGTIDFHLKAPDSVQVFLSAYDIFHAPPFMLAIYCGAHIAIDDLRVRKYTDPEPTYSIGQEQLQGIKEEHPEGTPISHPTMTLRSGTLGRHFEFMLTIPEASNVSLHIYDISGRKISTILNNKSLASGKHLLKIERHSLGRKAGIFFVHTTIQDAIGSKYILMEKIHMLQ